jgi:hypothetical protein
MGTNIPSIPMEPRIYLGGVSTYYKAIDEVVENGYTGLSST